MLRTGEEGTGLDALCGYTVDNLHVGHQNPTTSISLPFHAHTGTRGKAGKVEGDLRQHSSAGRAAAGGREGAYGELRTP